MRRAFAAILFLALSGALATSFTLLSSNESRAFIAENATFLIPASEGYGIADCLGSGRACGAIVAQAWCEAHGYGKAAEFGLATRTASAGTGMGESMPARNLARDTMHAPLKITCTQ
jgi:hypothetical protein